MTQSQQRRITPPLPSPADPPHHPVLSLCGSHLLFARTGRSGSRVGRSPDGEGAPAPWPRAWSMALVPSHTDGRHSHRVFLQEEAASVDVMARVLVTGM